MSKEIESPIQGKIFQILVKAGDAVKEENVVAVLESMKMEIEIYSPFAGVVNSIKVKEGETVEPNEIIITLD
jgi:biotin carboxyl carrier protein